MSPRDRQPYAEHTGIAPDGSSLFALQNLSLADLAALDTALCARINAMDRALAVVDAEIGVRKAKLHCEKLREVLRGGVDDFKLQAGNAALNKPTT